MQINTQLNESDASKLAYIQQQTNQDVTEVVKHAIDLYYQQLQVKHKNPLALLEQAGFIGCGEAEPNLSVNYKSVLQTKLQSKYGNR